MLHIKKEGNVFGAKLRLAVVAVMAKYPGQLF